jgi:hypothetical protein
MVFAGTGRNGLGPMTGRCPGRVRLIAWTCLCLAVGCSEARSVSQLKGVVTVAGKPASGSTIRFFDEANQLVGAATVGDGGEYVATDLPRKQLRVAVEPGQDSGVYASTQPPPGTPALPGAATVPPAKIPEKFRSTETSGLTANVTQQDQTANFSLD